MPFIYKDLEAEVINDFVDVEFQNLEIGNLRLMAASDRLNLDDYERLRRYNHVLFLGNAGIGKTTFQRRAIITLATKRKDAQFVWDGEVRLPIYVPLKAIDNSAPYPILNYILRYNPLFSQAGGLEKLIDLASHRKLSLFLDGYDEIPFTGGGSNFVQIELGLILFPASIEESVVKNTTFKEFYEALPETRVWLSSRREFFEQNPIPCPTAKSMNPTRLTAVELIGIGNNRIKLAKNIFDKYRRRAKKYEEILSEEYFLFDIESSNDNELKRLSYNPLFLTVMCYIYAQKAIDANSFKVTWANNFEGLVFECINLLLNDLHEIKARDLPAAHRAALLTRRNAFLEEKQLFLQYFA
jgi:predicted NACHT family NTPase